jgi:hypothetical protein
MDLKGNFIDVNWIKLTQYLFIGVDFGVGGVDPSDSAVSVVTSTYHIIAQVVSL